MAAALDRLLQGWIETFSPSQELNLLPLLQRHDAQPALHHPWGQQHRPDWEARGLVIWPRGQQTLVLSHSLRCPTAWRHHQPHGRARLALRWWAEAAELRINGCSVHRGDLFDAACRWSLPPSFWAGETLELELELCSPRHDDGALLLAQVELEPQDPSDPEGLLLLRQLRLLQQQRKEPSSPTPLDTAALERVLSQGPHHAQAQRELRQLLQQQPRPAPLTVVSHAHLDLAWLWPVADTWQAAERTFTSVLQLMEEHPELRFGHSTPALYHWLQQHRPALFKAIHAAMERGQWEALNGPWVETDCVLVGSASLLRQFLEGQRYSQKHLPASNHSLAWLPDSFGFSQGVPAVCRASGVAWFITHKLFWNADQAFPHRLFRWRHPSGAEVGALMSAPIGSDGDPTAMASYSRQWQQATGVEQGLWLPGVGDHGGGPSREMLEQLQLWSQQPLSAPRHFGTVRGYLNELEALRAQLPIWRDELYLELHRGCPTSRPDQKRHNRSLERLLLEADLAQALGGQAPSGRDAWRCLMFQQFHDILPGTSIPEVFDQAEPQWRQARRQSRRRRDAALADLLPLSQGPSSHWWVAQLLPAASSRPVVRLPQPPAGLHWHGRNGALPQQAAAGGGCWLQLPPLGSGVEAQRLHHAPAATAPAAVQQGVELQQSSHGEHWLSNGLLRAKLGGAGVLQLQGAAPNGWGEELLREPMAWRRFRDRGEFWDAWDLAADYRQHPLPFAWESGAEVIEQGALCTSLRWRGCCGTSPLQLQVRLQAGSPWLELSLSGHWRQVHELLRAELPLAQSGGFWSADAPGGVQERPMHPLTSREASRWEAAAISWICAGQGNTALAVLLDGPQGVSGHGDQLGISLLRGPTWPDPSADQGWQRLRLALMPAAGGWWRAQVAAQARRFRQPLWKHPAGAEGDAHRNLLAWGDPHQQFLGIDSDGSGQPLQLLSQNLSPCRSLWPQPSAPWSLKRSPWPPQSS